jgi:hypothetical protein
LTSKLAPAVDAVLAGQLARLGGDWAAGADLGPNPEASTVDKGSARSYLAHIPITGLRRRIRAHVGFARVRDEQVRMSSGHSRPCPGGHGDLIIRSAEMEG